LGRGSGIGDEFALGGAPHLMNYEL
jgi:hypothetical protein